MSDAPPFKKRRVLISAYGCEPGKGSESGVGWNWAMQIAKGYEVYVVTRLKRKRSIEPYVAAHGIENPKFIYVELPKPILWFKKGTFAMNIYYLLWHLAALFKCRRLVKELDIEIAHHVSFMSLPRGAFVPFIGTRSIIGPAGGLQTVPKAARPIMRSRLMEAIRDLGVRCFRFNPAGRTSVSKVDLLVLANAANKHVLPKKVADKALTGLQIGTPVIPARPVPPDTGRLTIHWSGRFVDHKGFELMILAMDQLKRERPEIFEKIRIEMTAKGPLEKHFREMIDERGMAEHFEFLGWVTLDEMAAVWARTDAFVFTSLRETTGMALQEAMMRGVAPIVIDNGGPGEMVADGCGIRVMAETLDALVAELAAAIAVGVEDRGRLLAYGAAARERALEHYSWDAVGGKMRKLYEALLNSERPTL